MMIQKHQSQLRRKYRRFSLQRRRRMLIRLLFQRSRSFRTTSQIRMFSSSVVMDGLTISDTVV